MPRHDGIDDIGYPGILSAREKRCAGVEDRAGITGDSGSAVDRGQVAALVGVEPVAVAATENEPPDRHQVLGTPRAPEPASEGLDYVNDY